MKILKLFSIALSALFLLCLAGSVQAQSAPVAKVKAFEKDRAISSYTFSYPDMDATMAADLQKLENQNTIVSITVDLANKTIVLGSSEEGVPQSKMKNFVDGHLESQARIRGE